MKQYFSFTTISRIVASVLLFWAGDRHQYGYFILLRWIVCGVSCYCFYLSYPKKNNPWTWIFGFVAILINPLIPIHLDRHTWSYVDIVIGIVLLASIIFIKDSNLQKAKLDS